VKRAVAVVQLVALLAAVVFVVALFVNEPQQLEAAPAPSGGAGAGGDAPALPAAPVDAEALFAERCASCHGPGGSGGSAPQLSDGRVAAKYPDIEDQVAVVSGGRGRMPAFAGRLTEDEIRAVVRYTRTL
jgi:cytochrome c6